MGGLVLFVSGVLVGLAVYWLVFQLFWRRWRRYHERDMAYLQGKIASAQGTNLGLERQLSSQKADLAGLRARITDLERENRQALARLEEGSAEKQAMVLHLEALRVELAACKQQLAEQTPPALALPHHTNGKNHVPSNGLEWAGLLQPVNGSAAHKNGGNGPRKAAPEQKPANGSYRSYLPPEPFIEPEIFIARPKVYGDRLDILQGVGPVIVKKLNDAGIETFRALAQLTVARLKEIVGPRAAKLLNCESIIQQAQKMVGE